MGAIDGTADLLFRIGADPSDAQNNIARFRGLLSKDLAGMKGEFSDWAESVFGNLGTVKGAMIASGAALAAGLVAVATAASHATDKYTAYVEKVDEISDRTGIAVEEVSKLLYAADATRTSTEALTAGLTIFATQVSKAASGSAEQVEMFRKWGISGREVQAGTQNMLPLLQSVSQRFSELKSNVDQTALSRDMFGRGGAQFLDFLRLGREGLGLMANEAERLHLVLNAEDLKKLDETKAILAQTNAIREGVDIQVGRMASPLKNEWNLAWSSLAQAITGTGKHLGNFYLNWAANWAIAKDAAKEFAAIQAKVNGQGAPNTPPPATPKVEKAKAEVETQDWEGLSSLLDQVRGKMAGLGSDEEQVAQEAAHLQNAVMKAAAEYLKLRDEKKLTAAADAQQASALEALASAIPQLQAKLLSDLATKRREEAEAATAELRSRITSGEEGYEAERAAWNREMDGLREQYRKKGQLTQENEDLIAEIRKQGLTRIAKDQSAAFVQELAMMQSHLAQIVVASMTSRERLEFERDQELAQYSDVEKGKALELAQSEGERAAIEQQFAINRSAILRKYGMDLQSLMNSQGWQGVFGSRFAQLLRNNENALRLWATSSNQALLMVRLNLVALSEFGKVAFADLAQGMMQNAASAIVYSKSVGEAMQSALAATLTSIAAEAGVQAIYAMALGFLRLAQWDFSGAASAFTSAAIFGTIGTAAAVAGRAVAPKQGGAGSSGAGGDGATSSAAQSGGFSGPGGESGTRVTVIVQGHIIGTSGIDELTDMINEAVVNRDVRLISTVSKSSKALLR